MEERRASEGRGKERREEKGGGEKRVREERQYNLNSR
jgi:hypothetical protein